MTIYQLGENGDGVGEFGRNDNTESSAPGSASLKDDDYYFAGFYGSGIGNVATSEPVSNFEGTFSGGDRKDRIHFTLTTAQLSSSNGLRFIVDVNYLNSTSGPNPFVARLNGTVIASWDVQRDRSTHYDVEVPISLARAVNTLELDNANPGTTYMELDYVLVQLDEGGKADTDNDGSTDLWEGIVGTNPGSPASFPAALNNIIGINFTYDNGLNSIISSHKGAGYYPQLNWNNVAAVRAYGSADGNLLDVSSPKYATIVNGVGSDTAVDVSWTGRRRNFTPMGGSNNADLFTGMLDADNSNPVEIDISNIPYANYELVLNMASHSSTQGTVTILANSAVRAEQDYRGAAIFSSFDWVELRRFVPLPNSHRANVLRFSDLTDSSIRIRLSVPSNTAAIGSLQIVDLSEDDDGDGMPTAWELRHRLNTRAANQNGDPDGDGVNNLAEYQGGTDPHDPDTDDDGLSDGVETNTGTFVSNANTGTDPNYADSDDDGLSDYDELFAYALNLDPSNADTDGDTISDREEIRARAISVGDLNTNTVSIGGAPRVFTWEVPNVQIIKNHLLGQGGNRYSYDREDLIRLSIRTKDESTRSYTNLEMRLRVRDEGVDWNTYWNSDGAFYRLDQNNERRSIYTANSTSSPLALSQLGFSGHGAYDISDRLTFRTQATQTSVADNLWDVVFTLRNQDTGQLVVSRTVEDIKAFEGILDGSVIYTDNDRENGDGRTQFSEERAVSIYLSNTRLEDWPQFAAYRDSDNDGMPDVFEDANGLNKNNASDASGDADGDSLTALQEFFLGTNPNSNDTDGDGVRDNIEALASSDPNDANVTPTYAFAPPSSIGDDFNNDGLPDAWQARFNAFGLASNQDDDNDGMTNAEEAVAGTDPNDALSRLWMRGENATNASGMIEVCWPAIPNKVHRLYSGTTLSGVSGWQQMPGTPGLRGDEYVRNFATDEAGGKNFYQVRLSDRDQDGDGLSDATEGYLGFDPTQSSSARKAVGHDTNNDGVIDTTTAGDVIAARELLGSQVANAPTFSGLSHAEAARFLMQATFGPTMKDIEKLTNQGIENWIDEQINTVSPSLTVEYVDRIRADFRGPRVSREYRREDDDTTLRGSNFRSIWARYAIGGEDQLRQRVAFALSQILVISQRDGSLSNNLEGLARYYDILVMNAFGNFEDILQSVTVNPMMGRYLSSVGNEKAEPAENRFPDENYAREIMQLFSIGLWELNNDGSRRLDGFGEPIPTYTNEDITELAKVMTGLWFGGSPWGNGGYRTEDYIADMDMHAEVHDFTAKSLLGATSYPPLTLPAREATDENGMAEVRDAVSYLFNHPNTGPFICKQLIQFLVTDNPSPSYVSRVVDVFNNNGGGIRGDLGEVVKAILLDSEARNLSAALQQEGYGKLREPVIRTMHLARVAQMDQYDDLVWWDYGNFEGDTLQLPMNAPSVFNYFRPDHSPAGILTEQDLVGPVFQITNSYTAVSLPNRFWQIADVGFDMRDYVYPTDYAHLYSLTDDVEALLDRMNLVFCAGRMSAATREIIRQAITPLDTPDARAKLACYLSLMSSEGSVQR